MLKGLQKNLLRCHLRFKAARRNKPEVTFTIQHDGTGLTVVREDIFGGRESRQLAWHAVNFVVAFKWDMFAIDEIAMRVMVDMEDGIEVDESMRGWESLIDSLPSYLPGAKRTDEWWGKVAFPAFATNMAVIYKSQAYHDIDVLSALEATDRPKADWFVADIVLLIALLLSGLFIPDFLEAFHFSTWLGLGRFSVWVSFGAVLLHIGLVLFWLSRILLVWEFYLPNKKKRRLLQIGAMAAVLAFYAALTALIICML